MSRWTLEQWLGLRKLREDWDSRAPLWLGRWPGWGLVVDGTGHLLIGALAGSLPAYAGAPLWVVLLAALLVGLGRELWQFTRDSSPNPNLVDRFKDTIEVGLGGLVVGLLL